nr:hypothetical protein [Tanacetum cinerariifolium]
STPVITAPTPETTTSVTNAQLQEMIDQGIAAALAARDANRNGDNSHTSRTGRPVQVARECTYPDFLKCQPLNFKGTEVKGTDVVAYRQCFQELALIVMATKPKTMQDAIEFATELMNKKINTWAQRQADNKRKSDDTTRNNHQQPNKRQNTGRVYAAGNGERKEYAGTLPLCNKCRFHHNGQCTIKCTNCKRVGHLSRDCRSPAATNNHRNPTCYERGNQGHYRSDCPELKN